MQNRRLGGGVSGTSRALGRDAGHRRHGDDAAVGDGFVLATPQHRANAEKRAAGIQRFGSHPVLGHGFDDARPPSRRQKRPAGDASEHRDRTELRFHLRKQVLDRALLHDVDLESAMAVAGKRLGHTARAANIEISHGDREAIACKRAGGRLADAAGCPGDNCNPLHSFPLHSRGAS